MRMANRYQRGNKIKPILKDTLCIDIYMNIYRKVQNQVQVMLDPSRNYLNDRLQDIDYEIGPTNGLNQIQDVAVLLDRCVKS